MAQAWRLSDGEIGLLHDWLMHVAHEPYDLRGALMSGTRVFKNSNVETMTVDGISELGTNGAIIISGVYFDSSSKLSLTDQEITVSSPAST